VAVSDDARLLAVGGGDRVVHVWDARSREYIQVRGPGVCCAPGRVRVGKGYLGCLKYPGGRLAGTS